MGCTWLSILLQLFYASQNPQNLLYLSGRMVRVDGANVAREPVVCGKNRLDKLRTESCDDLLM